MSHYSISKVPTPINETVRSYAPGTAERVSIKEKLKLMSQDKVEIPCIIGGKEVRTGKLKKIVMPHQHRHVLAEFHVAGEKELNQAAAAALEARHEWESLSWSSRSAVFLKAADLLAGSWRDVLNASTMLGQSKNVYQAEIDAACELIDFFRFNAAFYEQILSQQPYSPTLTWNRSEYRSLEGFVLAITPFNFTSIAGNLPSTPALVGNTAIWKPANTQVFSAYYIMKLFEEAGLPPGVINFVPTDGALISQTLLQNPHLSGVHFTGSTSTFQSIWKTVGENISRYQSYPRLVGETGGKDFIFAHPSSDADALSVALVRGAFEYQGQKCSAASRAYIPQSLWKKVKESIVAQVQSMKIGDVADFSNFINAVIDEKAFKTISGYIDYAKKSSQAEIIVGGQYSDQTGYFIEPTIIQTQDPKFKTMVEEIFGPVLTVFVYPDDQWRETARLCDQTSPYALTGAIFAQDRRIIDELSKIFLHSAGNFYVNDKPTGAVVGQQPFGGGRASGTNDKAGSLLNLYRWISARSIKENFSPAKDYRYPFMKQS